MKTRLILTPLLLLIFLITGAPSLYFEARIPASVDLPGHILSLGLAERHHSTSGLLNFIEKGPFSGILPGQTFPSRTCLDGIRDQVESSGGIRVLHTGLRLKRPGSSTVFPEPLRWSEVERYCREAGTDALLVMEVFDYNFPLRGAEVYTGFRLYDPVSRQIVDRIDRVHRSRSGNEDQALFEAAYGAGRSYGKRIQPSWLEVERYYYKNGWGNKNLSSGARLMEMHSWEAAIDELKAAYQEGNNRSRGRAAHNLAVAYEFIGEYGKARTWVEKAWGEHRNRRSGEYTTVLNNRIREVEMIRNQALR